MKRALFSSTLGNERQSRDVMVAILSAFLIAVLIVITSCHLHPNISTWSKSIHDSGPKPSLVYTNIGDSFQYQEYIWISIEQSRKLNPSINIYLVLSRKALTEKVQEKIRLFHLIPFFYDDERVQLDKKIQEFEKYFFVKGEMVPIDGNQNFVQFTLQRLFYVYAVMKFEKLENVFHLENDNLIYVKLEQVLKALQECSVKFGVPFAEPHQAVVSFMFVQNQEAMLDLIDYILQVFAMGSEKASEEVGASWLNDMTIVYAYVAKKHHSSREVVELPSIFFEKGQNCIYDRAGMLFDACVLGQWFAGTHVHPDIPFYQNSRLIDPRNHRLEWRKSRDASLRFKELFLVPSANKGSLSAPQVVNLHIHSKRLEKYISPSVTKIDDWEELARW